MTINVNLQPMITGPTSLNENTLSSVTFDSLISATDDSAVVSYRFTDVSGEGYLTVGGPRIMGTSYTVLAANLGQVGFYTGTAAGTNSITIEAIDDLGASSAPLTMQINVANQAPSISGPISLNKSLYQNFDLTSLFTGSDPDGAVAFWNFRDATPGPQAYLTVDGNRVDSANVSASSLGIAPLGNIGYYTGTSSGTNTIEVWATDNAGLSSTRKQVTITTGPNTAPTITGPASVTMGLNDTFDFAPLITATDVDGEVARYRFTDSDIGGGQLTYDGAVVSGTSFTVSAADMLLVGYLSGLTATSNTIAIEAIDNVDAVSPGVLIMRINAQANQAPTLSGPSSFTMGTNVSFDETDALFTSLLTAADADGTVALYVFTDSTPGAGFLTVNGAQITDTSIRVVAADLGQVGYTTGSSSGSNSIAIEAIDNMGLGTARTMTIIVEGNGSVANQAPTISGPASVSKGINESFKFGTASAAGVVVLAASDPGGTVAQYRFWDSMPGAGYLTRGGNPIDGTSVIVSAADLGEVGYYTGASAGSNSIVMEAIDNMGLASPGFLTMAINVTGAGGMANQAPTITGPATVGKLTNESFTFASLISADDADGDVAQYRFTDSMPGAGSLVRNNVEAPAVFTVAAANLGEVSYNTGAFAGSNTIAIEAIDNLGQASPRVLTMTISVQGTTVTPGTGGTGGTANQAPTISGPASISKNTNEVFDFTLLISGSDADGSVAHYRFWDSTPGAGNLTLNDAPAPGVFTVAAANLSQVGYSTGAVAGSNVIAIEAIDDLGRASPSVLTTTIIVAGTAVTPVTPVTPVTGGTGATANQAPTISGPASISKSTNEFFDFTSLISGSDADGSVAQYRFWDSTSGAGYLTLDGASAPGVFTVAAANLSQVGYSTGAVAGSNVIAIEAIDNLGRTSPSVLTTTIIVSGTAATGVTGSEANRAPTISGPTNVSKSINQSFDFTSLVSASDADGSVAQYRFSDSVSGAGHLTLNGVQLSGTSVTVTAANLAQVGYYTGASAGSNTIAIEAIDNLGLASPRFLMMAINVNANSATTVTTGATVPLADLGHDMALYQGRVSGYTVASTATGYNVTIKSGAFPTDTLQNVDWVLFDDLAPYGDGSSAVVNTVARTIDGGAGIDTLTIHGSSSQYTIAHTATGFTVHNAIMGSQWVTNVERLMFNDGMVALDIHGNAGMAYRLYQAAFNRTPDLGGLGYQMTALDNGLHLVQVAGNFIASPEFQSKYGNLTNEQFVRQLYANVLHREAEVEGYGYHLNNLNNGFTRADLLVGFSESPENQAALIGVIQDGMSYTL